MVSRLTVQLAETEEKSDYLTQNINRCMEENKTRKANKYFESRYFQVKGICS